jgi:3'(2'), 5'-bisphosphate nucleotidase
MDFSLFGSYAREAQVTLLALYDATLSSLRLRYPHRSILKFRKPDHTIVTIADFISQAHILASLTTAFPSDIIVAEECLPSDPSLIAHLSSLLPSTFDITALFGLTRQTVPATVERWWTVDPIDGTSGFCIPNGHFAIAIALIVNGHGVFSGVAWPTANSALTGRPRDEPLYYLAAEGCGAFVTNGIDPFVRVTARIGEWGQLIPPAKAPREATRKLMEELRMRYRPIEMHSMVKALALLEGMGRVYWRSPWHGKELAWDIAPIAVIVQEAGAMGTIVNGKEIRFAKDGTVVGSENGIIFTVGNRKFHQKIMRQIQMMTE